MIFFFLVPVLASDKSGYVKALKSGGKSGVSLAGKGVEARAVLNLSVVVLEEVERRRIGEDACASTMMSKVCYFYFFLKKQYDVVNVLVVFCCLDVYFEASSDGFCSAAVVVL